MPEVASVPAKETESAWLYQPLAFGAREGVALTLGAVSSYLKAKERAPVFPAASWQLPLREALPLSGPP
jgi:hypothetical protein